MDAITVHVYEDLFSAAKHAENYTIESKPFNYFWVPSLQGSDSYIAYLKRTCAIDLVIPGTHRDVHLTPIVQERYLAAISHLIKLNIEQAHLLVAHRFTRSRIRSYKGLFYEVTDVDKGRHEELELDVDHQESIQAGALKISLHNLDVCLGLQKKYNGQLLLFGDSTTIISKQFIRKTVEEDTFYPENPSFSTFDSITKIVCEYNFPVVRRIGDSIDFTGFRVFAPVARKDKFSEQIHEILKLIV